MLAGRGLSVRNFFITWAFQVPCVSPTQLQAFLYKVWRELSGMLDIEPTISDTIALAHRDPEAACCDMFSRWLSGEGVKCTWEELIKNLERMKFHELAQQLIKCLND